MRRQGSRCERYCEAMLSAPLTAPCPRYSLHIKGALVLLVGLSVASRTHTIRTERSAALQLLESLPDQLVKLLRLRGERLHLVLSELRLKRQNLLKILCLGDLFDQCES